MAEIEGLPEKAKRIPTFQQLIEKDYDAERKGYVRRIHTGKAGKKEAWADGYMMELAPMPDKWNKDKTLKEIKGGSKNKFSSLIPKISEMTRAIPIASDVATPKHSDAYYSSDALKSDVVILSNRLNLHKGEIERDIGFQKKYIDYFQAKYPDAVFYVGHSESHPAVAQSKGKIVGVIMPFAIPPGAKERLLKFAPKARLTSVEEGLRKLKPVTLSENAAIHAWYDAHPEQDKLAKRKSPKRHIRRMPKYRRAVMIR